MLSDEQIASWVAGFEAFGANFANALVALLVGVVAAAVLFQIVFMAVKRAAKATENELDDLIVARVRHPAFWCFIAIGVTLAAQADPLLTTMNEAVTLYQDVAAV